MSAEVARRDGPRLLGLMVCVVLAWGARIATAQQDQATDEAKQEDDELRIELPSISPSEAEREHRLHWHFKRVDRGEGAAAGALAGTAIALSPIDVQAHWAGNNRFDDWFQGRLMVSGAKQDRYNTASNALAGVSIGFPVLVDLIGVTLIGDRNRDVGLQTFAIQAQAFALTGFVTNVVKLSGRQRPCAAGSVSGGDGCSEPNKSFFSSHTSLAFTGAGLTCAQHLHLKLFGRVGDPIACAGVLAVATTTGVFRVVANRHWMTDVLTGAGVGLLTGWLMPWLMHYRHDLSARESSNARHLYYVAPYGTAGAVGLSAAGTF